MLVLSKIRNILGRGYFSTSKRYSRDLLTSQFHNCGLKHFQKSKLLARNISTNIVEIEETQLNLEKIRKRISQDKKNEQQLNKLLSEEDYKSYYKTYEQLCILLQESKMNEEWYYRIVGWFNVRQLFGELVEKMMKASSKGEHVGLVQTLGWMHPKSYALPSNHDFREEYRQQRRIGKYYKNLNMNHDIPFLKTLESILCNIKNDYKAKYYSDYTELNLPKLIKKTRMNKEAVDHIFWLVNNYVETYNDGSQVIEQFQHFMKKEVLQLTKEQLQLLSNIYGKIGRIDNELYECYLRPFLQKKVDSSVADLVKYLEFIVYSQCEDMELFGTFLKILAKIDQESPIQDALMKKIHILIHYLKIKGFKFEIGRQFGKKLDGVCRLYEGSKSVARSKMIQLDQENRRDGKQAYISDCLRRPRGETEVKQDEGTPVQPNSSLNRYPHLRFCSIDINNCVVNPQSKQAIILQKNYQKFYPSESLGRQRQVRDTILEHYGFKINYMERTNKTQKEPLSSSSAKPE